MKKKLIMTLIMSTLSLGSASAAQAPGMLEFVGKVTNPSCYVQLDSMSIQMGTVSGAVFGGVGTTSGPVKFDIELVNCPISVGLASVTFMGTSSNESKTILAITDAPNSAKGLGIEILTEDNQPITLDQPTPQQSLTPGLNRLPFMARLIATDNTVIGGDVHASAMFAVSYN